MSEPIQSQIQEQVSSSPIFLYMKGTPEAPACGFSHEVVHTLRQHIIMDLQKKGELESVLSA